MNKFSKPLKPLLSAWGLDDASGVIPTPEEEAKFSGLAYDSRKVEPGDLFFCIRGEKTDGNKYIAEAFTRGAIAAVSDTASNIDARVLKVPDVRLAMSEAADYFNESPSASLRLLAVTGTNGKTSTTHIIEHIFRQSGKSIGLIGTMGARWQNQPDSSSYINMNHTTPQASDLQETLARMRAEGIEHVAMEVSSHALSLHRVAHCQFASACLTNITQDHLDFHKTMENYWKAKQELFHLLGRSKHEKKYAVINIDEELAPRFIEILVPEIELFTYGFGEEASCRVLQYEFLAEGSRIILATPFGELDIRTRLLGLFNVYNAVAGAVVCLAEGLSPEQIINGLATFKGVEGRFELVTSEKRECQPICIVDYAHSPDGLSNVLKVARQLVPEGGKLYAVFGCGGDRDSSKRPQMGEIAESLADKIFVTSDNPRSEDPEQIIVDILAGIKRMRGVQVEKDRARAIESAVLEAGPLDVIVVAGKGHETYQILKDRTLDFDDRVEVRRALSNRRDPATK